MGHSKESECLKIKNVNDPYATAFSTFIDALDRFGVAHRKLWMEIGKTENQKEREALRKESHNAKLKCIRLYNDLLTKLQETGELS